MNRLIILLCILLYVSGCDILQTGVVREKKFTPARTETRTLTTTVTGKVYTGWKKPGRVYIDHKREVEIPAEYHLFIEGEEKEEWVWVEKECFDSLEVGDYWELGNCPREIKHEQRQQ